MENTVTNTVFYEYFLRVFTILKSNFLKQLLLKLLKENKSEINAWREKKERMYEWMEAHLTKP